MLNKCLLNQSRGGQDVGNNTERGRPWRAAPQLPLGAARVSAREQCPPRASPGSTSRCHSSYPRSREPAPCFLPRRAENCSVRRLSPTDPAAAGRVRAQVEAALARGLGHWARQPRAGGKGRARPRLRWGERQWGLSARLLPVAPGGCVWKEKRDGQMTKPAGWEGAGRRRTPEEGGRDQVRMSLFPGLCAP